MNLGENCKVTIFTINFSYVKQRKYWSWCCCAYQYCCQWLKTNSCIVSDSLWTCWLWSLFSWRSDKVPCKYISVMKEPQCTTDYCPGMWLFCLFLAFSAFPAFKLQCLFLGWCFCALHLACSLLDWFLWYVTNLLSDSALEFPFDCIFLDWRSFLDTLVLSSSCCLQVGECLKKKG